MEVTASLAIEILRDLRGLRVELMHPPDVERGRLVDHLMRIGCVPTSVWPLSETSASASDLIVVAIEHENREVLRRMFRQKERLDATIIGIVGYENPSTLQLVLEIGAHAVIERPIRPFGLLTQLVIARNLWLLQHETALRIQRLERKLSGVQAIHRARLILMANQKLTEDEAYQTIRSQAMAKRKPIEDVAATIIDADVSSKLSPAAVEYP